MGFMSPVYSIAPRSTTALWPKKQPDGTHLLSGQKTWVADLRTREADATKRLRDLCFSGQQSRFVASARGFAMRQRRAMVHPRRIPG